MPSKLRGVVVLYLLSMGLDLLLLATGHAGAFLSLTISGTVLYGLLRGSDGMRTLVIALAWLGLVTSAAFPLFALATAPAAHHSLIAQLDTRGPSTAMIVGLFIGAAIGVARSAYVIWTLKQSDVREWMFKRAFHLDA